MLAKVNKDFLLSELSGKKEFAEMCIHAESTDELIEFTKNAMQKSGFFIASVDNHILDGRGIEEVLKPQTTPIKIMIKGFKRIRIGSRHSALMKASPVISGLSVLYYFLFSTIATQGIAALGVFGGMLAGAGAYMLSDNANLSMWIKIIGVKEKGGGRFKVFIAGDTKESGYQAESYLSENFAEIKDNYSRNFIKHRSVKGFVKDEAKIEKVISDLENTQSKIAELNKELENSYVTDSDYERRITDLEKQRANLILATEFLSNTTK